MADSPLVALKEAQRQQNASDANFVKKFLYFFELRVDPKFGIGTEKVSQFIFPLVVGPEAYDFEEPFAVEKTFTQGGGLYVEENGIILRTIRLRGNTGFKPRRLAHASRNSPAKSAPSIGQAPNALGLLEDTEERSFNRDLPANVLHEISGQRHFQYLQDAVFRIYGDLKRDPEKAQGTQLLFHNPRDQESWLVIPERFVLRRDKAKRVLYEYDIELTAVDKGTRTADFQFSEDKNLFDKMKDTVRTVKASVDAIQGFINDVTATIDEARRFVKGISTVIDSVASIFDAAQAFAEGTTDLIKVPLTFVQSTAGAVDSIVDTLTTSVTAVRSIPTAYTNSWQTLQDSLHRLGTLPELFETDAQRSAEEILNRQQGRTFRAAAEVAAAPTTIDGFGRLGTSPLPGEVLRSDADLQVGVNVPQYSSAKQVTVKQGDTLMSLAARYLGDSRSWQDIARLNGLKAPFLDTLATVNLGGPESPIPGLLATGSPIMVPSFTRPPKARPLLATLGVSREESFENQLLGTDYRLAVDSQNRFDWEIDEEGGSIDLRLISGKENLAQGMSVRLSVERGSNILYRTLGLERIIGIGNLTVDSETARLRIKAAIEADPRIASVRRVDTSASTADALIVDADAAVRGFSQGVTTQAIGVL